MVGMVLARAALEERVELDVVLHDMGGSALMKGTGIVSGNVTVLPISTCSSLSILYRWSEKGLAVIIAVLEDASSLHEQPSARIGVFYCECSGR